MAKGPEVSIPPIAFSPRGEANPFESLLTWRAYVAKPSPEPPSLQSFSDYWGSSAKAKREFNDLRSRYIFNPKPIALPGFNELEREMRDLVRFNSLIGGAQVKQGAVLEGQAGVGKTTFITSFARQLEIRMRKDLGHPVGKTTRRRQSDGTLISGDIVPVVVVSLAASTSPKDLSATVAGFIDPRYRESAGKTTKAISEAHIGNELAKLVAMYEAQVIIIDEIHFLNPMTFLGTRTINHLKNLANRMGVTFILVGISTDALLGEGLGPGDREASQIEGRFRKLTLERVRHGKAWKQLLLQFEKELLLLRQEENSILTLSDYIYKRTDGYIQSLASLLKLGAIKAIESGKEHLDYADLESIRLDVRGERLSSAFGLGPDVAEKTELAGSILGGDSSHADSPTLGD